jgi:sensor domain CHASE-containing protein
MTLRTKTTLIVSSCFLALIALLLAAAVIVMLGRFRRLEEAEALRNARRAGDAVKLMADNLAASAGDWAHWDETAAFVQGRKPEYVAANLTDDTYRTLKLDVIALIGSGGRVVYERWFDRTAGTTTEPPTGFSKALASGSPLVTYADIKSHHEGLLVLPGVVLLVASQPVTGSVPVPPAVGAAVFGRILNHAEMTALSDITQQDTHLAVLDDPSLSPDERMALTRPGAEPAPFALVQSKDRITSLLRLKDVMGDARVALIVNAPRPVFREGVRSIYFLAGSLTVFFKIVDASFIMVKQTF